MVWSCTLQSYLYHIIVLPTSTIPLGCCYPCHNCIQGQEGWCVIYCDVWCVGRYCTISWLCLLFYYVADDHTDTHLLLSFHLSDKQTYISTKTIVPFTTTKILAVWWCLFSLFVQKCKHWLIVSIVWSVLMSFPFGFSCFGTNKVYANQVPVTCHTCVWVTYCK